MEIDRLIQNTFAQLSSGKRINTASDDPSGLAISERMTAQINGHDQSINNALTSQDLANTADGALSSIGDSLQRIREIAVQASNGTYTASDKKIMQAEIDQLKQGITETARNTEFNTIKLLDGTFSGANLASDQSGQGRPMTIQSAALESLGIDKFDVTKDFNIEDLDNAISKVSDSRSSLGAFSNRIDYQVSYEQTMSENLSRANSQLADADYADLITQLNTQQLQQKIQLYTLQSKMNQHASVLDLFK